VAARQTAPVIGALCGTSAEHVADSGTRELEVSFGYRYQTSHRHFVGTVEQKQRDELNTEIVNTYHLFDIGLAYRLNSRWTLTGSVPILVADRNQLYPPRGFYEVNSIGDISAGVRAWLWRPPTESGGNIALGISLKMPTGKNDAASMAIGRDGNPVLATADQSLQAGDGGWGFALDTQMYKRIPWGNTVYFSGTYLFNPRNTTDVQTFRIRPGEEIMSVTDQYLFRGGISHAVPKIRGLAASIGGRIEGVPVRDAFGSSDGFRRPGYAISVDPGLVYARGRYLFAVNVPFAVERNRRRSVTDLRNGSHGDAAFADYVLTLSVTRRFDF
jgi:hypothetical protein